ncbi:DUF3168 domain-containing protein [Neobacillus niacini]|uniref:DUF3168 domain-containing protein n=1 Tax=Neobacillus niacini TaxID=86668 RepID=UPI0021CB76E6|nr:DUF3168 domain-containing protein [Neobacillus niacini]MCM3763446.1 DUF3168 domain-containing protein [Neobacillus niacini]
MNFEDALRAEFETITGLTNKIFPLNAPEGEKAPFIVYVSSDGVPDKSLQGYLSTREIPCEIYILHDSYAGMKAITKEVVAKILSFQGRVIGENGPFIQNATFEEPVERYEKEISLYRSAFDLRVKF